jgi:putative ABC transport system permease protein
MWAQSLIVSRVGLSSLHTRLGRSLVIAISMACATGVLLSLLSMADGLEHAYGHSKGKRGNEHRLAIVTSAQAGSEQFSRLPRSAVETVLNAPGIAKSADGALLASIEVTQFIRPVDASSGSGFGLRGIGSSGTALRPQFRIVDGRMFRAGARELIAGRGLQRVSGLKTGDSVILPDGEWPIVGVFSAGGNIAESQVFGDVDALMTSMRISGFNSVLVELESPQSFGHFSRWLTENPALTVKAEDQAAYYLRTHTGTTIRFFTAIAYVISAVLAVGALFGAVKLLYSSVRMRTREIATLRAMGYEASPVAASVVLESIVLSLSGALLGACIAWLLFDGKQTAYYQDAFQLSVSPRLFLLGAGWALMLALLGGVLPAIRAARLPVAEALRAV